MTGIYQSPVVVDRDSKRSVPVVVGGGEQDQWDIFKEEDAEYDTDILKIYEGNIKAWDYLIISLRDITFGLVIQCNKNAHETWMAPIDKYEVSEEKQ